MMKIQLKKLSAFLFFIIFAAGCNLFDSRMNVEKLGSDLQSLLDEVVSENKTIPGAALHVEIPHLDFSWYGASGFADRANKIKLKPQNPVRIASNTKTFVAVAILKLCEQGQIDLDSSIRKYLSVESLQIISKDGYTPELMTVRHLLTHTSGLFNYTESKEFSERYEADVQHRWTRNEQLKGAMDWGEPYGSPGEIFHYSDTGYILLGEILEQVTGKSFGSALRTLLNYDGLGLTSTWLETLELSPPGILDRAHQYEGDFDTYAIDPSIDLYGGGGIVSTVGDLARFMQAVFTNCVFSNDETINTMLSTIPAKTENDAPPENPTQGKYCMGIEVAEVNGKSVYINYGYWGTMAVYVLDLDFSFAATVNQHEAILKPLGSILSHVIELVDKIEIIETKS